MIDDKRFIFISQRKGFFHAATSTPNQTFQTQLSGIFPSWESFLTRKIKKTSFSDD